MDVEDERLLLNEEMLADEREALLVEREVDDREAVQPGKRRQAAGRRCARGMAQKRSRRCLCVRSKTPSAWADDGLKTEGTINGMAASTSVDRTRRRFIGSGERADTKSGTHEDEVKAFSTLYDQAASWEATGMPSLAARIGDFCKAHRLRLNTDLGQHFLIDEPTLDAIIAASRLQSGERALEIGPGIGVLTERLLQLGANVTAIELDERMLPLLAMFTAKDGTPHPNLQVLQGNALAVPFPSEPYRIVANIPYHITSPLLRHAFLECPRAPESLTLLIQREVAERIADPEDRGLLTIIVALFGVARIVKHVPPQAFLPPPAVDSAVLHIDCHPAPLVGPDELDHLIWTLKMGFHQKRKMLRTTIGRLPGGEDALAAAKIDGTRRPQTLTPQEWIVLAKHLPGHTATA